MPKPQCNSTMRKRNIGWMTNSCNPTLLEFFCFAFSTHRVRAFEKYQSTLQIALERSKDQAVTEKLQKIQKDLNWEQWMQEKTALSIRHSVRQTNLDLHEEIIKELDVQITKRKPSDTIQQNKSGDDMGEEDVDEVNEDGMIRGPYILTSGTDVTSVLKSYMKDLPDGLTYWGILDLTGDSITSKVLFIKEDWAEMVQSFRQEVKLSETLISDNVSCLFDKIDKTI
ncbi:hypothetical protein BC936DRAFT_141651 [Jimgerdemannia flammicorona]|uniref:Uncharacterized protein n=1 Tax=Jimgerdemannia flammicorona TaxID=994334 RepID=A0A433DG01_9FUNG|nr:hypothetical protein BC936DRAFT_141651 [Jimgerdemannia flammicorona]